MDIVVSPDGSLRWAGAEARCALGRGGISAAKREGDGATPAGVFPLRRVMFRPDRLGSPETGLPIRAIEPSDGWCDDPRDARYNQLIRLPCGAGHERLWRDDGLYDLLAVIGYNDDPIEPGRGSAIFLHVARPNYGPTEGCVALALPDLQAVLRVFRPSDRIVIELPR